MSPDPATIQPEDYEAADRVLAAMDAAPGDPRDPGPNPIACTQEEGREIIAQEVAEVRAVGGDCSECQEALEQAQAQIEQMQARWDANMPWIRYAKGVATSMTGLLTLHQQEQAQTEAQKAAAYDALVQQASQDAARAKVAGDVAREQGS